MSGDVQPRKRKDKKRKKDDGSEHGAAHMQTPITQNLNEEQIHVHKEEGTGGGICAKIVFFLLFTALAVCIGLIITEHRGLTDLETTESESRFSQLFEGWIDTGPSHEEEHLENALEDHDEENDDEVDHDSNETHDDEEQEEEEEEEVEQEEEEELSKEDVDTEEDDEEEEEEEIKSEEDDDEEADEDNEDRSDVQDEDEDEDEEENVDVSEEKDEAEEDDDQSAEEHGNDDDDDEDEENEQEEEVNLSEQTQDDEEDDNDDGENEVDDERDVESEEQTKDATASDEDVDTVAETVEDVDENPATSRMAVKIGVGLALLVVAYVVLVRKWKTASSAPNDKEDYTPTPDLSRRNTIVVPPTFQQIKQDIEENVDEEYSEDDGEVDCEDDKPHLKTVKVKYQQLRTTYSRSLTPEDDPNKYKEEDVENVGEEDDEDDDEDEEIEDDGEQLDDEDIEEEEDDEEEDEGDEEEEDEDYENEDYEEEDEDLMKRLEAKYGKLSRDKKDVKKQDQQLSSWKHVNVDPDNEIEGSDSDKQSDDADYEYENVTNKNDWKIKEQIDEAQKAINKNAANAVKLFDVLLEKYPNSPRCYYGKAQALDRLAEQKRSNSLLQQAISVYLKLLDLNSVPDVLFENVADRCINRMRFIGDYSRAINVHLKLIDRFPNVAKYRNQLAVSYLTINRPNKARIVLEETLSKYPNDGFALVHYGFILKTSDNNLNKSVDYMRKGLATKDPGVIDGRFFFHLGDALTRLGRVDEAMEVYEEGVANGLFLSKYQRSLYNVDRLTGKPWWNKNDTPYQNLYHQLESNWETIRYEGLSVLSKSGYFQNESENLKDTGDWKQFELFARGQKNVENCKKCPATCRLIETIPDARGCRRGQTKFSVMHPGTHVWPHCGPTNCRLRVHLGLSVPPKTYIRVADEIRSWENGKVIVFDDSFEHEVWHNGTQFRLVLIVDVWHPELTITEKRTLSPI